MDFGFDEAQQRGQRVGRGGVRRDRHRRARRKRSSRLGGPVRRAAVGGARPGTPARHRDPRGERRRRTRAHRGVPGARAAGDGRSLRCLCGRRSCSVRCRSPSGDATPSIRVAAGSGRGRRQVVRRAHRSRGAQGSGHLRCRLSHDGDRWRLSGTCSRRPPGASRRTRDRPGEDRATGWSSPSSTREPTAASLERVVTTDRQVHPHLYLDGVASTEQTCSVARGVRGDTRRHARGGADRALLRSLSG